MNPEHLDAELHMGTQSLPQLDTKSSPAHLDAAQPCKNSDAASTPPQPGSAEFLGSNNKSRLNWENGAIPMMWDVRKTRESPPGKAQKFPACETGRFGNSVPLPAVGTGWDGR